MTTTPIPNCIPAYSTASGTYYCTECFTDLTYDQAVALNPDIN